MALGSWRCSCRKPFSSYLNCSWETAIHPLNQGSSVLSVESGIWAADTDRTVWTSEVPCVHLTAVMVPKLFCLGEISWGCLIFICLGTAQRPCRLHYLCMPAAGKHCSTLSVGSGYRAGGTWSLADWKLFSGEAVWMWCWAIEVVLHTQPAPLPLDFGWVTQHMDWRCLVLSISGDPFWTLQVTCFM